MQDEHQVKPGTEKAPVIAVERPRIAYHGTVTLAPGVHVECAVLDDKRRGFMQRQMVQGIGFTGGQQGARFDAFCSRIGLNSLVRLGNPDSPIIEVTHPGHGVAFWAPWEVLPQVIKATTRAAARRQLTKHQNHIAERCADIGDALMGVGIVALIDEATGFQYHREPTALQDMFARILRSAPMDWERRFQPDFYRALCRLRGWKYEKHRPLPSIIGQMTERWVYEPCFSPEVMLEMRGRRGSEKLHQWLTEQDGLKVLLKQIGRVTDLANSSVDHRDFEDRASVLFPRPGQQISLILPPASEAATCL